MFAQAHFSQKQLHGLNTSQMQEAVFQKTGLNWNDTPIGFKRGRWLRRSQDWLVEEPPIFTQERSGISGELTPTEGHA